MTSSSVSCSSGSSRCRAKTACARTRPSYRSRSNRIPMKVLVTGGAGYIGSHMVKALLGYGAEVVTFDNLSSGHRDAIVGGEFVEGDITDPRSLASAFAHTRFDAVMHFASLIQVGESVQRPSNYYRVNVAGTINLLEAM